MHILIMQAKVQAESAYSMCIQAGLGPVQSAEKLYSLLDKSMDKHNALSISYDQRRRQNDKQ